MAVIEANGETLAYVDEGAGPEVLFIHSLGTNASLWRDQIAVLKQHYRCIAFDCRGHGDSSYNGTFTIPDVAADLKAGLDALGIASCHVVGLSMGGPIALYLNAHYPGVVRSLVLADAFATPREGAEDRIYATQEAVAYLSMLEFGNQYAGDRLLPTTPIEKLEELAQEIAKVPAKAYVDTVRAIFTFDVSGTLARVDVPTLVLIGDQDQATPMADSEFIRQAIEGAELKVIPDAGHLTTIDNPDAVTTALKEFLDARMR